MCQKPFAVSGKLPLLIRLSRFNKSGICNINKNKLIYLGQLLAKYYDDSMLNNIPKNPTL